MISSKTYCLKLIILIANVVSVCIVILPNINELDAKCQTILGIIVIMIEIFLIIIGKAHENNVDKDFLGRLKQEVIEEIKPAKYSQLEEARAELRSGIKIMLACAIVYGIIIFFIKIINLQWALVGGLVMIIAYIYADYVPHSQKYAENYDKLFIAENEKPSALRGLGRIYLEEYQKTRFRKKDKYYKEMAQLLPYDGSVADPKETKIFLKCIFGNKVASTNNTLAIIGYVMLAINILTVVPDLYDFIAQFFSYLTITNAKTTISMCATIIFMTVSVCQLYEYYCECYGVKRIVQAIDSNSLAEMLSVYSDIEKGHNGRLYRIRGSFDYSQNYIEQHNTIKGCPMKYRMKFPDKYYANISRYNATYLLSVAIFFLILSNYTNFSSRLLVVMSIVIGIGYVVGKYVFLPQIGRRRIQRICEELGKSDRDL